MRQMTAADLCDECDPPLTTWIVKHFSAATPEDVALSERPCPNCRYKTPLERMAEAALAVCHIRMLAHADGMTMSRGTDLKWALVDLEEAVAGLNRNG